MNETGIDTYHDRLCRPKWPCTKARWMCSSIASLTLSVPYVPERGVRYGTHSGDQTINISFRLSRLRDDPLRREAKEMKGDRHPFSTKRVLA